MHLNSTSLSWKISGEDFSVWKHLNARKYSSSTKYLLCKVQLSSEFYVRSLRWIKINSGTALLARLYKGFISFRSYIYGQYSLIFSPTGDSGSRQWCPQAHVSLSFHTCRPLLNFPQLKYFSPYPPIPIQPILQIDLIPPLYTGNLFL